MAIRQIYCRKLMTPHTYVNLFSEPLCWYSFVLSDLPSEAVENTKFSGAYKPNCAAHLLQVSYFLKFTILRASIQSWYWTVIFSMDCRYLLHFHNKHPFSLCCFPCCKLFCSRSIPIYSSIISIRNHCLIYILCICLKCPLYRYTTEQSELMIYIFSRNIIKFIYLFFFTRFIYLFFKEKFCTVHYYTILL